MINSWGGYEVKPTGFQGECYAKFSSVKKKTRRIFGLKSLLRYSYGDNIEWVRMVAIWYGLRWKGVII